MKPTARANIMEKILLIQVVEYLWIYILSNIRNRNDVQANYKKNRDDAHEGRKTFFIVVLHTYPIVFEFPFQPVVRIFINITSFISCLIGN